MEPRALAATMIATALLVGAPNLASSAFAQQAGPAQLNDHLLPVAAGALVGAAVSFFLLPLVIPATAVAATGAGVSATASPIFAAVGAGVGGVIGYKLVP
jgi:hypothetical protein